MSTSSEFLESGQVPAGWTIVQESFWTDYEENGWIVILENDDGEYCSVEGGYCVMDPSDSLPKWEDRNILSEKEVYELMQEWDEIETDQPPLF